MYNDIRVALDSRLNALSGLPDVDWENVGLDPVSSEEWVQARLAPAQTRPAVAGPNPTERYNGTYLINIFWPSYEGPKQAEDLARRIKEQFPPGDVLTNNGVRVRIRYSEQQQAIQDPPYYQIPVVVSWYAFI